MSIQVVLEAQLGQQSWEGTSGALHLYIPRQPGIPITAEEYVTAYAKRMQSHPLTNEPSPIIAVQVAQIAYHSAYVGVSDELTKSLGKWSITRLLVNEGTVLKAYGASTSWGDINKANVYIRPRETAPLNELVVTLPKHAKSRFSQASIKGRFDVLSVDEAVSLGVKFNLAFAALFRPVAVSATFKTIEHLPGTKAPIVKPHENMEVPSAPDADGTPILVSHRTVKRHIRRRHI